VHRSKQCNIQPMSTNTNRMPLIDALKAIAALLVLLNHFSSYGPLAAAANQIFPATVEWLYGYGRMAVQVFLVIAGFLAARGLSADGQALATSPLPLIWKRYLRLAIPFLAAIGLAIVAAAIADHWMDDDAIPARATFKQWLAHALMLQSILGFEALSAGVWYVAIDFQLFALMAVLLWAGRIRYVAPALVLALTTASLFWFNRNAALDNWAIYFFGSYGLGAAAWWASDRKQLASWLGVIAVIATAALVFDFRLRILLALAIALILGFARRTDWLERFPDLKPISYLGQISFSIFLVHFPILLLANGLYAKLELASPASAIFALILAFTASIASASLFYRWIESPVSSQRIAGALGYLIGKARARARKLPFIANLLTRRV
jgi:peptidoglycan/LPS O-acetylase OafA/YrhL